MSRLLGPNEPATFSLRDHMQSELVELHFWDDIYREEIETAENKWRPELKRLRNLAIAAGADIDDLPLEHDHWNWGTKRQEADNSNLFYGISCEGELQVLMMLSSDKYQGRLEQHRGQPLLYIDYLEAAPWNLSRLVSQPRFKALGSIMIEQAILASLEKGCEGRLGLHSLDQSTTFYDGCGMILLGQERLRLGGALYSYFELTAAEAARTIGG